MSELYMGHIRSGTGIAGGVPCGRLGKCGSSVSVIGPLDGRLWGLRMGRGDALG
jgi:hypothetical protein